MGRLLNNNPIDDLFDNVQDIGNQYAFESVAYATIPSSVWQNVIADGVIRVTYQIGPEVNNLWYGEYLNIAFNYTAFPTNRAPVATTINAGTTNEDVSSITTDLLQTASDPDGDDLDTEMVNATSSNPDRMVAFIIDNETGQFEIDPSQFSDLGTGNSETVTVSYNVVDGKGGVVANRASLVVEGRNDAPMASTNEEVALGTEDNDVNGTLQPGSDVDRGDALSFVAGATAPVGGSVVIDAETGAYVFTPDENFNGTASFSYAVSDGEARSAEKIIEIGIAAVNDAPTDLDLGNATVAESTYGATIGMLTTTDVDLTREGDSHGYAITGVTDASGNALAADGLFEIVGNTLKLKDGAALDFETNPSYRVEVTTTDAVGATYAKIFDLTVEDRPYGADWAAGFQSTAINDWYNPVWGGGFNATVSYTVQEDDLVGGDVYAWDIAPNYTGNGTLTHGWMNGFNATASAGPDEEGDFALSTDGQAFQRKLIAGDVLNFTVQVHGAGYDEDDFAFAFADVDQAASASSQTLEIDAAPTNSWGSGLSQNVAVRNTGTESVDDWTVELDVPDDMVFNLTGVWGATATKDADGDIVFEALGWNSSIGAGGAANFGFNASYDGGLALLFEDSDFAFV
ncbi:MAG: cadherin-like domain-containing protein [Limimaricola soesokkakensis]